MVDCHPRGVHRRDGTAGRRGLRLARCRRTSSTSSAAPTSSFTLMGSGDCFDELVALRDELGLGRLRRVHRTRPGRRRARGVLDRRRRPLARSEESAQRRLHDEQDAWSTWRSSFPSSRSICARPACRRVARRCTRSRIGSTDYARAIVDLLDDEPRRKEMGQLGRLRIEHELAWPHQAPRYVGVYDQLLGRATRRAASHATARAGC